jgi:hypothetical protein
MSPVAYFCAERGNPPRQITFLTSDDVVGLSCEIGKLPHTRGIDHKVQGYGLDRDRRKGGISGAAMIAPAHACDFTFLITIDSWCQWRRRYVISFSHEACVQ